MMWYWKHPRPHRHRWKNYADGFGQQDRAALACGCRRRLRRLGVPLKSAGDRQLRVQLQNEKSCTRCGGRFSDYRRCFGAHDVMCASSHTDSSMYIASSVTPTPECIVPADLKRLLALPPPCDPTFADSRYLRLPSAPPPSSLLPRLFPFVGDWSEDIMLIDAAVELLYLLVVHAAVVRTRERFRGIKVSLSSPGSWEASGSMFSVEDGRRNSYDRQCMIGVRYVRETLLYLALAPQSVRYTMQTT